MHAIVRCGKGQYYISTVFGYFCKITATDDYKRYLESIHNQYYWVLDREKKKLIKQYVYDKNSKYLDPSVLVVESNEDDWQTDEDGCGCVSFLKDVSQATIEENMSEYLLKRCIDIDAAYSYDEYPEIKVQADIDDLMNVSGWFHDACIEEYKHNDDGSLYVLFDGTWGCKIEVWFEGDVSYSVESRNPEEYDPYWYGSTILIDNGYVYFVDEENMSVENIGEGYCWFKARRMKYHVIPNE